MSKKPVALIYSDEGVGTFSLSQTHKTLSSHLPHFDIQTDNHKTLKYADWEKDAALLVFPGGPQAS